MQTGLFICSIRYWMRPCMLLAEYMGYPNACDCRNNTRNNNLLQKVGVDCENSIIEKSEASCTDTQSNVQGKENSI